MRRKSADLRVASAASALQCGAGMKKSPRRLQLKSTTLRLLHDPSRIATGVTSHPLSENRTLCSSSCMYCPTRYTDCCVSQDTLC